MDTDTPGDDSVPDGGRVERHRPDHFASTRRSTGVLFIGIIWLSYVLPVGFLTVRGIFGDEPFSGYEPWLLVLIYAAAIPLIVCVVIAVRNLRVKDRRRSLRLLGCAAACFVLGYGPLMIAASTL